MDFEELNKPGYKPRFVSEYSMGQLDFIRYNEWLKYIETYSSQINSTDIPTLEMIQSYFSGLNVLWKLWRPIVSVKEVKEKVDVAIKETKKQKRSWENNIKMGIPPSNTSVLQIIDNLDEIHTKLMEIKQVIGLGIIVKRNLSMNEKIKAGIHGHKDFSNLPEA